MMARLLVLLLVFAVTEGGYQDHYYDHHHAKCAPGFVLYSGSCYHFSRVKANWPEAAEYCRGMNAELAIISSEREHNFLKGMAEKRDAVQVFLGATDLAEEGTWTWINGRKVTYKNWGGSEPNGQGNENCLTMYSKLKYKWNDSICDYKYFFICEN